MKVTYGWHFTGDKLRDGSPIPPVGKWLKYKGEIVMCESGLHFSRTPFDALQYAPGDILHYVAVRGVEREDRDKGVARERKIIRSMDAEELLRYSARMQALSMVHLWDAPDVVLDYLMTGDDSLRAAARDAARDAARVAGAAVAARDAARDAAWAAAWAARDAAWAAAWAAAWDAARVDFDALVYESFGLEGQ